ncbi:hypothetical protein GLOIN_2v1867400 [Rhizophagus irregularis DAOM 181602=DAOM 197198]|uniref:Uncharacterized protein n=1 Tax=Rhizophagus irregularis (strain DAOM 181602 / DAOM 197198 / MUCL 43194) TaxID=747089 RepID=A0A2P4QXB1_RHIID|nr:hypothetical protein GLOIN_2v1867400 [Rhizophagus irregularis DAOM 181602=DAOM 197198]POG82293.1 hypothetical protein GLOIN_2v1867400 [Rhizophagus irregularis DAOM 181602=DAOM 197198]|eukprot:XP_025189159.1 hypothetical protein GLOIN_2v1867400 [Rhizophagus irregularis DAOM 181602=DAOM 197198]
MVGRIMEAGYAHSERAVLLCNTWDLVVSEGSGDVSLVIGSWVLIADDLRNTLMRTIIKLGWFVSSTPVFSHEQLYVACSRITSRKN